MIYIARDLSENYCPSKRKATIKWNISLRGAAAISSREIA